MKTIKKRNILSAKNKFEFKISYLYFSFAASNLATCKIIVPNHLLDFFLI